MRIRITIERDAPLPPRRPEVPVFAVLAGPAGPKFRAWLPSVCLHAALLAILASQAVQVDSPKIVRLHGAPLKIRLDGITYHISKLPPGEHLVFRAGSGKNELERNNEPGSGKGHGLSVATRMVKVSRQTVVREDLPPDILADPNLSVPNIAVWTVDVPTLTPRLAVEPGPSRRDLIQQRDVADNHTAVWADMSNTAAVRAIASGDEQTQPETQVLIPAGNMGAVPAIPQPVNSGGTGAGAGIAEVLPAPSGGGSGNGNEVAVLLPPSPAAVLPIVTIRRPATGKFDAVVVQTSGVELFEGAAGTLSGKPVYTVYLPMGTRKDWILQYCTPRDRVSPPEMSGPVVSVTPETPIEGPWPTLMQRVPVTLARGKRYMLVHGYVSTEGRLERLRVVEAGTPETTAAVVQALSTWEFRPARRDSVPVTVEILMAIPADVA